MYCSSGFFFKFRTGGKHGERFLCLFCHCSPRRPVSSFISLDSDVSWYPVEYHSTSLGVYALQLMQNGSKEVYVVPWLSLLDGVYEGQTVSVDNDIHPVFMQSMTECHS